MIGSTRTREEFDWERIQNIGLLPGIRTVQQYDEKVFGALLEAKGFVQRFPTLNPSVDYMRILHRMVFREVHPWAGEIRQPGRLPPRVGGFVTCEAERLGTELKMLESQTTELLSKADRQGTLRVIAFHHARFESLHPFLDGNGRVGRLLVESQLNASPYGVRERPEVSRQEYGDALRTSSRISNLLPAGQVFGVGKKTFSRTQKALSETNHVFSGSDNAFLVTENGFPVSQNTFSVARHAFAGRKHPFFTTNHPFSDPDKTIFATEKAFPSAENADSTPLFTPNAGQRLTPQSKSR